MGDQQFVLYSYWRSSASWRVRAALLFKGINHEIVEVNLVKGEHKAEDYLKINPSGAVPTLNHAGEFLNQSVAMLEYLEEICPDPPLFPKDVLGRARVRALIGIIACDTHPIQNLSVIKKVAELQGKEGTDTVFAKWVIEKGFTAYENMLATTMGAYSYGDSVTAADLCLVAQHYNAVRFEVDLSKFPRITAVVDRLKEVPCIRDSHPSKQSGAF